MTAPGWLFRALVTAAAMVAAMLGGFAGPAPASPATLSASGVHVAPGEVRLQVSAPGLSPGSTVSVRAAGRSLRTETSAPHRRVVVVLDTSGSMAGDLTRARSVVDAYADALDAGTEVGLVTTGGQARTVLAPTADRVALDGAVSGSVAKGKTALYDGLRLAAALLRPAGSGVAGPGAARSRAAGAGSGGTADPDSDPRILVLSDGQDTISQTSLKQLDTLAPTVDAIAFGRRSGAALRGLTARSGGKLVMSYDAGTDALGTLAAPSLAVRVDVPGDLAGARARLDVTAVVAGQRLVATVPVRFAAAAGPAPVRVPAGPGWLLPGAAALTAAGLFLALVLVLRPGFVQRREERRLNQIEQHRAGRALPVRSGAAPSVHPIASVMLGWTERVVRARGSAERITVQLDRAGVTLRPNEWLLLRICVALAMVALGVLLLPWWAAVLLGAPGGWLLTRLYLGMRGARRARGFAEQLPDSLQLVIGALRSGFSLPQSLDVLVREGGEPVAGEFGRALAKTRLGIEMEAALDEVAERTGSQDLEWLVMAIRIQREIGGNLAEVLQTTVDTMRERSRLRRHVRALSAEGRLSAWVLTGMPIAVAGWLGLTRAEYLRPLVTEPMGVAMLTVSVVMLAVGAFWMSRLVKVEV
jgi:tight adherence protein B